MSETPDLTFWLHLHRAMRTSGDRLAAALATIDDGDRRRARALSEWFDGFDAELHHHHMVEDEIFFPALAARVPTYLDASGPEIDADHERLDELLACIGASLRRLAGDGEWAVTRGEAYAGAAELAELLHRHLGLEDQDVLPLFCRHFTAEEFDAMTDKAAKSMSLGQARFTVPWLMTHLDRKEQGEMLAVAPAILKVVWWLSRRGYARRASLALGTEALVA